MIRSYLSITTEPSPAIKWASFDFLRVLATILAAVISVPSGAQTITVNRANIYDGQSFVRGVLHVEDGQIVEALSSPADHIIDAAEGFVVPAFGEGHHHSVTCNPPRIRKFMEQGIYYVQIMNWARSMAGCIDTFHNKPDAPDLALAWAGLTSTGGHPTQIGAYFLEPDDIEGNWTFAIDSTDDIAAKWPAISAQGASPLKIFLNNSEGFQWLASQVDIDSFHKGINPALVPLIVERARADGLRTAAHVVTAHDFDVAVQSGVDIVAHMPGFHVGPTSAAEIDHPWIAGLVDQPERYMIHPESAELAAKRGVLIITTFSFASNSDLPRSEDVSEAEHSMRQRQSAVRTRIADHNFRVLKNAGAIFVIGSDRGEGTSVDEALGLAQAGMFSPAELLHALSRTTPRAIFPDRQVGCLKVGCEASFLILGGDPLSDFSHITNIKHRIKDGTIIGLKKEE